jgi:hypothetical protein
MSDIPARDPLDIRAILVRIDRDLDEAAKLRAEARKFDRERWIAPFTIILATLAAIVARLPEILAAFGVGH